MTTLVDEHEQRMILMRIGVITTKRTLQLAMPTMVTVDTTRPSVIRVVMGTRTTKLILTPAHHGVRTDTMHTHTRKITITLRITGSRYMKPLHPGTHMKRKHCIRMHLPRRMRQPPKSGPAQPVRRKAFMVLPLLPERCSMLLLLPLPRPLIRLPQKAPTLESICQHTPTCSNSSDSETTTLILR